MYARSWRWRFAYTEIMRLWSLHPSLLDSKGLVACWRETLLAQKVLDGATSGYISHPQLVRFRAHPEPMALIGSYLRGIWDEATARGYNFDATKILSPGRGELERTLAVTDGQVRFEAEHLLRKLNVRDPERALRVQALTRIPLHPLFVQVAGPIEAWEKDALAGS